MIQQQYPSQLLERAVQEFAKLPGVGRKTALRLVLHLLRLDTEDVEKLTQAIQQMKHEVKRCNVCHNISDSEVCPICSDPHRDASTVCVVENIQDVMAVENTQQFTGLYHVLGGVISPMDGIGADDIRIKELLNRLVNDEVKEVILALKPSIEGETTSLYISRVLSGKGVRVTKIAQGIPMGADMEYIDMLTLEMALSDRKEISDNN